MTARCVWIEGRTLATDALGREGGPGVRELFEAAALASQATPVTGDCGLTAKAIATQIGLPVDKVITGEELDRLPPDALRGGTKMGAAQEARGVTARMTLQHTDDQQERCYSAATLTSRRVIGSLAIAQAGEGSEAEAAKVR
jgi:hypothetical protein